VIFRLSTRCKKFRRNRVLFPLSLSIIYLMKISKSLLSFLKSTSTVLIISSMIGGSTYLINQHFWSSFLLSMAIQYVLFSVVASTLTSYFAFQTRQKELDKLTPLSTILDCAACKSPNITTFIPDQNERFEFECQRCKDRNVVNINFVVAKVTEFTDPIQLTPSISRLSK
jgi:hypothetical protein